MRHSIRQVDLADALGYEQSYISALEVGLKGPPSAAFVERLAQAFPLSELELHDLQEAVAASRRMYVLDTEMARDKFHLARRFHDSLAKLTIAQIKLIEGVLELPQWGANTPSDPPRRLRRRKTPEVTM